MPYRRRQIILVDDVSFHLLSTKERLKKYYEVFPVQSAEALFELLYSVEPELILMDINMPESDGFETIEKLKADPRYEHIPVIFFSASNDRKNVIRAMNLGAVDFIAKPYSEDDLANCIEGHLDPYQRSANKPIVLAVDDSPSILKAINHLLHDNYTVYTLPDPERLKDLLKMITPDLFLLDCNMPVLNGFDLVPVIRATPLHEETPIIFVTSDGTIDNISVALHLGAVDYIVKPIDDKILRSKTAQHLEKYILRRRIRAL